MPSIRFKVVYTENTVNYNVNPHWKLDDFFNIIKTKIIRDFNIEQFELVEAGQNTWNGRAEEADALDIRQNISLYEKYGANLKVSFYIRPIIDTRVNANIDNILEECVICYTSSQLQRFYGCIHPICTDCIISCNQNSIHRCSICRRYYIQNII